MYFSSLKLNVLYRNGTLLLFVSLTHTCLTTTAVIMKGPYTQVLS